MGESSSARARGPNGGRQLVDSDILEQITGRARGQCARHEVLFGEAGQGDDSRVWATFEDQTRGGGAVYLGHHQVHEHDIRLQRACEAHGFAAASGLARELEIVEQLQKGRQSTAHNGVIVDDQHADHVRGPASWSGMGRAARTQGRHRRLLSPPSVCRSARARTGGPLTIEPLPEVAIPEKSDSGSDHLTPGIGGRKLYYSRGSTARP